MTYETGEQITLQDLGLWCGKTSPEPSAPTKAKTSKPSSRKSSKSRTRMPMMCLCLKAVNGPTQDTFTTTWVDGVLPGGHMTLNSGAYHSDENGFVYSQTGAGSKREIFYLNAGEKPRKTVVTKLSQILETHPDNRFNLSPRACQGILSRAERRGKKLPETLEAALRVQAIA